MITVQDLVVQRGDQAVLRVKELHIKAGETLALIGPNGAGKSTLLLTLALLIRPQQGQVWFKGQPIPYGADLTHLRRRMATVFQEPLLVDQTVFENVALGLRLRGLGRQEITRRVTPWLDRLGIAHLARRPARQLSGGEAQRTSLARAFVLAPELMLLDEPFTGLDAPSRVALLALAEEIIRETGITTVFVTHDRDEALTLGDRVGILIDGHLAQVDTPGKVFNAPVDIKVAQFVGVENIWPGMVIGRADGLTRVRVGPHTLSALGTGMPDGPVSVCLRPEDISLVPVQTVQNGEKVNELCGVIVQCRPAGVHLRVTLDAGITVTALTPRRLTQTLDLTPGQRVGITVEPAGLHLMPRSPV